MRAIVLGGNGFIGTHLVDTLVAEGHQVRVVDRTWNPFGHRLTTVDYVTIEPGSRLLLQSDLRNIDIVYHLIGTTVPKTSNDNMIYDVQSNVIETLRLLEMCIQGKIRKIVFVSSGGAVYGKPVKLPVSEDHPTNPECSYGITKLMIEKYIALYSHLYGLDYVILRPSNAYGERQNPRGIQGAISVFLGKVANREPIEIWGDGEVVRDYIYVTDLVEGIYRASQMSTNTRIFNLGSGQGSSLNMVVSKIRAVSGCPVQAVYKDPRVFDIPCIYLDIARAQTELCWKPTTDLETGLAKTWEFVKRIAR